MSGKFPGILESRDKEVHSKQCIPGSFFLLTPPPRSLGTRLVLPLDAFEAFLYDGIFDKTVLCLGEKQVCVYAMLVNDKCSLVSVWDGRKKFSTAMDGCMYARPVKAAPLPECEVSGTGHYGSYV